MEIKNTEKRFGIVSILFHWTIAALMIGLIIVGLYMEPLPINALKLKLYGLHKEFGILVMFLAILRMLWLIINNIPNIPIPYAALATTRSACSTYLVLRTYVCVAINRMDDIIRSRLARIVFWIICDARFGRAQRSFEAYFAGGS